MENEELLQAIGTMLQPIHTRLDKIDTRLDQIDTRLDHVDTRLDKMDARFDKMDARLDQMDTHLSQVDERLDKIEQDVSDVKQRTTRMEVVLENETNKNIQLLAEGHAIVVEKLSRLDDVTQMAEDTKMKVDVMYSVMKKQSTDINELKLAK